jgi:hypothetical protein
MKDRPNTESEERLAKLLESLSREMREGRRPDVDQVAREHPDVAQELQ